MRVLIIGGTGVISTGTTPRLIERGDEVVLFNRGQTEPEFEGGYRTITGDRRAFSEFEDRMGQEEPFDCVIDMIAFEPSEVESAIRAFRGRTGQYVFCSTVDVYTKPAGRYPVTEEEERRPSEAFKYGFDKAECERILEAEHDPVSFPVTIIRPAHTYVGRLVHTLRSGSYWIDRMRRGLPIIVHGDGSSLWCSCHRDDVARAFVNAIGNPAAVGGAYHVTGEEWMTWDTYYRTVAAAAGAPEPRLVHIPTDVLVKAAPEQAEWCGLNFQFNNIFDNTRARQDLGFRYTVSFAEGARSAVRRLDARGEMERAEDYPFYDRLLETWERLDGGMLG